ncbi:MAG TPA: FAD binding domain-containing protein [Aestuariivirga sp.]|nr:FAD binding domain-containing protein [Aestuariivirga sp.]
MVDAAIASCSGAAIDKWANDATKAASQLGALDDVSDVFIGDATSFVGVPSNAETLLSLAADHPDATIVAGATDVGLWITKQLRNLPNIIHVSKVKALHEIEDTEDHLSLGAAVTYAEAESHLAKIDPDVGEVLRRLGAKQVRATGTIGGNIANGSPIGDMPPMLIALGATLHLRHGETTRHMPLESFFLAYAKQDRKPGELVWRIDIPKLKADETFRAYKISKRFDQDISAVMAAFKFTLDGRRIVFPRIAFGGMAATPKRAVQTEAALAGLSLDAASSWSGAIAALTEDYEPITDMRATAAYRLDVAQSLLRKALIEIAGAEPGETRLVGARGKTA